jgi:hypothetical protein
MPRPAQDVGPGRIEILVMSGIFKKIAHCRHACVRMRAENIGCQLEMVETDQWVQKSVEMDRAHFPGSKLPIARTNGLKYFGYL